LPEELLDLAPDLDLVGQGQLRVELVDESVLDAVLRLAEGLAGGQRAQEWSWRGSLPGRWRGDLAWPRRCRRLAGRGCDGRNLRFPLGCRPSALDQPRQRVGRG